LQDSDDDVEDDQDQVAAQQNDKKESKKRKSRKESHKESHISEEEKRANQLKEFFVEVNEVKASNKKIEEKVQELKAAHEKMLKQAKPDDKDVNEVEEINAEIRREANNVRNKLKSMETETEKKDEANKGQQTTEVRIRKVQQATLSRRFIDSFTEYNKVQNEYRDGCKERMRKQLEVMGQEHDDSHLEEMIQTDNPDVFQQQVQYSDKEGRRALSEVEMRHREIMKLEKSLQELHELFLDMARMVENQGETIDRIDNNVIESTQLVTSAKVETKKAVKYQKAARKKKIIIACVVVGIILIIILIVVLSVK